MNPRLFALVPLAHVFAGCSVSDDTGAEDLAGPDALARGGLDAVELEDAIAIMAADQAELEKAREQAEANHEVLTLEHSRLAEEVAMLQDEDAALAAEIARLKREKEANAERMATLDTAVAARRAEIEEAKRVVADLQAETNDLAAKARVAERVRVMMTWAGFTTQAEIEVCAHGSNRCEQSVASVLSLNVESRAKRCLAGGEAPPLLRKGPADAAAGDHVVELDLSAAGKGPYHVILCDASLPEAGGE